MKLSQLAGPNIRPIAEIDIRPTLTLDVFGGEHTGKSNFALNVDLPGGTFYQTTEMISLDGVLQKYAKNGIVVAEYDSEIPTNIGRDDAGAIMKFFKAELTRIRRDMVNALDAGAELIVWDKAVHVWEIIRFMHFGRLMKVPGHLYGPANIEFAELVSMPAARGASFIMINEQEDEWITRVSPDGKETRGTSGRKIRKGQDRTGYLVDASLRMIRTDPKRNKKGEETEPMKFQAEIVECRRYPELIGTLIDNPDFKSVRALLKPEVE